MNSSYSTYRRRLSRVASEELHLSKISFTTILHFTAQPLHVPLNIKQPFSNHNQMSTTNCIQRVKFYDLWYYVNRRVSQEILSNVYAIQFFLNFCFFPDSSILLCRSIVLERVGGFLLEGIGGGCFSCCSPIGWASLSCSPIGWSIGNRFGRSRSRWLTVTVSSFLMTFNLYK